MSKIRTLNVVIFGIGNVGSTLIHQINNAKTQLLKQQDLRIKIPVVTNSRLAFYDDNTLSNSWECDFEAFSIPYKIEEIIQFVKARKLENLIAIDATSSTSIVDKYKTLIQNGFHIVSANKVANTLGDDFYQNLRLTLKKNNRKFLYETNVGAGLPVIETVRGLYESGENIHKIRGVFSGSLSYIFNTFSSSNVTFSKVLINAMNQGLTESDVRVDLSGTDVARKLLILARELDIKTELENVSVESLVPKQLNGKTSLHQFNSRIKELNEPFQDVKKKQLKNHVLRYIGELDVAKQRLEVKLISEDKNSSLGQLEGADSVVEIYSDSYQDYPMVIRGAGAGKAVTARGLLSDIVKIANTIN